MHAQFADVPAAVVTALDRLKDDLVQAAGHNLAGLLVYGGLARGRYRPGKSDVNVVVLLKDASVASLADIAPALQKAWRAAAVEPMILTPDEVTRAADAFPTKFLDVKDHHVVLFGVNPFAGLHVAHEHVRLRLEQELRNLLLRLRRRYVAVQGDAKLLTQALTRLARPLALQLETLLRLAGKPVPTEDRSAAVFAAAAVAFDFDGAALASLAHLRQDDEFKADVPAVFASVMRVLTRAVHVTDGLKEGSS